MNEKPVICDERDVAVADRSYRFAYALLVSGSIVICAVRALAFQQACWDLFGLVIISSLIATFYQRTQHVYLLRRRWLLALALVGALVGAGVGFAAMVLLRK